MSPIGWQGLLGEVAMSIEQHEALVERMDRYRLTNQEREVAVLLLAGYRAKEICAHEGITRGVFYNLVERLSDKTGRSGQLEICLQLLGVERRVQA